MNFGVFTYTPSPKAKFSPRFLSSPQGKSKLLVPSIQRFFRNMSLRRKDGERREETLKLLASPENSQNHQILLLAVSAYHLVGQPSDRIQGISNRLIFYQCCLYNESITNKTWHEGMSAIPLIANIKNICNLISSIWKVQYWLYCSLGLNSVLFDEKNQQNSNAGY